MYPNDDIRKNQEINPNNSLPIIGEKKEPFDTFEANSGNHEKFFPEAEKWNAIRDMGNFFKDTIQNIPIAKYVVEGENYSVQKKVDVRKEINEAVKKLEEKVEEPYYIKLFGAIIMQGIRYLIRILKDNAGQLKDFEAFVSDYLDLCQRAFRSGDVSSAPVKEQIFNNICEALNIPPYPLGRLDRLYNKFNDPVKRKGVDMSEKMNMDLKDEIEKESGIIKQINEKKFNFKKNKESTFTSVDYERETFGREYDFWISMTENKYLIRQSKMQSLQMLIDGEISLDEMKKEYEKYKEIKSWKMN